jgi:hypothetical protein
MIAGLQISDEYKVPTQRGARNPFRQAMEQMPVGTSFFAPDTQPPTIHGIAKQLKPKTFTTQGRTNGTRVWRTA